MKIITRPTFYPADEMVVTELDICEHCRLAIDPLLDVVHDETLGALFHVDCAVILIRSGFLDQVAP